MSRTDRAIGIALGLIVGLVVLILIVFGGTGQSIDAPSLHPSQDAADQPATTTQK